MFRELEPVLETAETESTPPSETPSFAAALRTHWPEYLMEAGLLGAFMVSACLFGVLYEFPHSPVRQAISSAFLRRVLMGASMGLTAIAIIYSPWGKQSGAHINPSVTFTFFRLGKIKSQDAIFYIGAQFVGSSLVAALFSILILGWWGTLAVSGALTAGQLAFRSRSISGRLRTGQPARAALRSLPLYVAGWTLTGTSFWLTARALVAAPVSDIPVYVGAFAAAWLVGVLAIFAPGGLGVREALLVALLRGRLGTADALVLATASRAVLTFVDAGMAGLGFLVLRRSADSRQFETALEPPASSQ